MTRLLSRDDAITSGARALFGEKYGDEVRVVAMGEGGGNTMGWSVELAAAPMSAAPAISASFPSSVNPGRSGVRRIEALTG